MIIQIIHGDIPNKKGDKSNRRQEYHGPKEMTFFSGGEDIPAVFTDMASTCLVSAVRAQHSTHPSAIEDRVQLYLECSQNDPHAYIRKMRHIPDRSGGRQLFSS